MWPRYALSYVKGGDDAAALVTENLPNGFAVRLYPFTAKALAGTWISLRA